MVHGIVDKNGKIQCQAKNISAVRFLRNEAHVFPRAARLYYGHIGRWSHSIFASKESSEIFSLVLLHMQPLHLVSQFCASPSKRKPWHVTLTGCACDRQKTQDAAGGTQEEG